MKVSMHLIFFWVSFIASVIGAICGIGGGVIIKPFLDATGILSVSAVSFLSGCTVLVMAAISILKSYAHKEVQINLKITVPLAIGSAIGGALGKGLFQNFKAISSENVMGLIQAIILISITILTFLYNIFENRIHTLEMKSKCAGLGVGILLGFFSSFLGIGGGPINLMILSYLFSFNIKEIVPNSLFIIFISQIVGIV